MRAASVASQSGRVHRAVALSRSARELADALSFGGCGVDLLTWRGEPQRALERSTTSSST